MTAPGRSSQIISKAAQEQGLSHAGKCVWHHAVGWDGSAVLSQGSCQIAGPPAWPALRLQRSDKLQPPHRTRRSWPPAAELCRSWAMRHSAGPQRRTDRVVLTLHTTIWEPLTLQHDSLRWEKLNFAKQGKGGSGVSKDQRYVWNQEKFDLVNKSKLLQAAGLISSNHWKCPRDYAYHMFPI